MLWQRHANFIEDQKLYLRDGKHSPSLRLTESNEFGEQLVAQEMDCVCTVWLEDTQPGELAALVRKDSNGEKTDPAWNIEVEEGPAVNPL